MNKKLEELIEEVTRQEIQKFLEENKDAVIDLSTAQEEKPTGTMEEWMEFKSLLIGKSPRYIKLNIEI